MGENAGPPSWAETIDCLRRDIRRYGEGRLLPLALKNLYLHPALAGALCYRLGRWLAGRRRSPLGLLGWIGYRVAYPLVRLYSGVELPAEARIGPGLCLMHFGPIVIHPGVTAGANLTLLHSVTIGSAASGVPRLGANVKIGTGAVVMGGIEVGDDVRIGAGAVVTDSLPAGCTAVGVPARPVRLAGEREPA
ncbi:MAG TPA: hypothetical protein VGE07_09005, partial [Herpetosiphonaceae bacterium]